MAEELEQQGEDINLGHNGAGDDCFGKMIQDGAKFAFAGACFGSVEGCFLTPVPGSTTPMIVPCLKLILQRSIFIGTLGGVYAGSVCTTAYLRDKDDHVNASISGAITGSIIGIKYRSVPLVLGLSLAFATVLGLVKFRTGNYLPNLLPIPSSVGHGVNPVTTDGTENGTQDHS